MAQEARLNLRMQRELKLLLSDPPPGASFPSLSSSSSLSSISAEIEGPEGTVYAKGVFKLKIQIPERYPFQPPIVTFVTPIYHPNIDNGGRICLDILNLPPKGAWQPSLNISTVLTSIGLLLSEPNPDDGLMHDASTEYKYNRQAFDQKARSMTQKYARGGASDYGGQDQEIQALTNAREWPVEPGESNMANSEVPDLLIKQKRLCGLSRKLSLDSAGHGGINSGETMKEVPLSRVFCEQKEVRGAEQVTKEMPSELILNQNKVQWSRKKFSLESVGPSKVRNSEKRDYTAQIQCSTHVEPQSILQNYAGIEPLPQTGRNSNNNDMRDVGVNETTEKLLLKSIGSNLKNEDIEKLQMKPQLSAQFQSTASCQTLISSDTCGGHKICHKNVVNQTGSSFSARHKKLGLTGRTHSLGTLKKDNKANYAPPQNLPISDSVSTSFLTSEIGDVSTRKSLNAHGTSVKQPLQALDQFGEGKNSSNQLISQSGKHSVVQVNHPLSCEDLRDNKQNKQPNNDDHGNYNWKTDQQEKGSPECEAVIVLDSEDSEDETSLHKRSKLLLARRPMLGKRKA